MAKSHSFLWLVSRVCVCVCVCVCVYHIFFIHSSLDVHSGCYHILGRIYLFKLVFSFSLDILYPGVELLDHLVVLFLVS